MRYPIVLVHGIALKDFLMFKAFGKIEKLLRELGYTVSTADTDSFGTIENNAEQLKRYIEGVLAETGAERVNIIAHSKGGLDTRYMIDRLDMGSRVASVTFLCTPHKGSRIATWIYGFPRPVRAFLAFWLNLGYRISGDRHPDALAVCRQLSHAPDGVLEELSPTDGIYMQSYSTTLERSRDDFIMGIPLIFSRRFERDASDGLVSEESSRFADYRGRCVDGSVSHSEIVDFMVRKSKKDKIYAFYRHLCEDLTYRGC